MEIKTREQAEDALSLIGQIDARIKVIEGTAEEAKARINKEVAQDCNSLEALKKAQEKALESWGRANRTVSKKGKLQKTVKLKCGKLEFRDKPPAIELTGKEDVVISAIELDPDPKVRRCLSIQTRLDKAALKKLAKETLKRLGIKIISGDEVFSAKPMGEFEPYDSAQDN